MDIDEVLERIRFPMSQELESALMHRLRLYLEPTVAQFDAVPNYILDFDQLIKTGDLAILNELNGFGRNR